MYCRKKFCSQVKIVWVELSFSASLCVRSVWYVDLLSMRFGQPSYLQFDGRSGQCINLNIVTGPECRCAMNRLRRPCLGLIYIYTLQDQQLVFFFVYFLFCDIFYGILACPPVTCIPIVTQSIYQRCRNNRFLDKITFNYY